MAMKKMQKSHLNNTPRESSSKNEQKTKRPSNILVCIFMPNAIHTEP
jgi:hypothetical protein